MTTVRLRKNGPYVIESDDVTLDLNPQSPVLRCAPHNVRSLQLRLGARTRKMRAAQSRRRHPRRL